jgi:hypothetical protein
MPPAKPCVLLAARPVACAAVRQALGDDAEIVDAHTMDAALEHLQGSAKISLVVCTVYFDDSRMFDLLRWARAQCAHIPFVCARIFPKDITRISIEGVSIAVTSLGAAGFIDVPALEAEHGHAEAAQRLRDTLLRQIVA